MHGKSKKPVAGAVRNPDRTRGRILEAAIAEFAAKGQAGARVDAIARRAGTNKRMLYHYFGDKEGLFRAVLRWKILERRALFGGAPGEPTENLPFRFEMMCRDPEWIRLLGWEALSGQVAEEKLRRQGLRRALKRLKNLQAEGQLTSEYDRRHLLLAKISLTMFPAAFPNLVRLITGTTVRDPKFQAEYRDFLKRFGAVFRPVHSGKKTHKVRV
ncbi:MAG: TetR/AcrR family transcriptional regulator [Verrucomicrobia bacterium]|nr:TetR/AcrR family transcriptional regulator [Verrucomicrobiota bacterium]